MVCNEQAPGKPRDHESLVAPTTSQWSAGGNGAVGGGDNVKISSDYPFDGTSGNTTNSVALSTGTYFYNVSGAATGAFGGLYNLTSTIVPISPVPEPETYAMRLDGLGAVGLLARRRKNG